MTIEELRGHISNINNTIAFIEGTSWVDAQAGTVVARPVVHLGELAFASAPNGLGRETRQTLLIDRENELRNPDLTDRGHLREIDAKLKAMDARIAELVERRTYFEQQIAEQLQREENARRAAEAQRRAAEQAAQPIMTLYAELDHLLAAVTQKALQIDEAQRQHRRKHSPVNPPGPTWRHIVCVATALQRLPESIPLDVLTELEESTREEEPVTTS
jgi:hypothetical protein